MRISQINIPLNKNKTYSSFEAIKDACFIYQNATLQLMLAASYMESC